MTESTEADWAPWGKVGRPHGVRGELRVFPFGDGEPFPLERGDAVLLRSEGEEVETTVRSYRGGGKFRILDLEGVKGRDAASSWTHATLHVPMSLLESIQGDDEYYVNELVGFSVCDEEGAELGIVKEIADYGGGEILVYSGRAGQELLPFAEPWIVEIDLEERRLLVDPNWLDE